MCINALLTVFLLINTHDSLVQIISSKNYFMRTNIIYFLPRFIYRIFWINLQLLTFSKPILLFETRRYFKFNFITYLHNLLRHSVIWILELKFKMFNWWRLLWIHHFNVLTLSSHIRVLILFLIWILLISIWLASYFCLILRLLRISISQFL